MLKNLKPVFPFKGKNSSNSQNVNLLMNAENVYLMDNHLMAFWCFLQQVDTTKNFNLLHIDAHYDLSKSEVGHGKAEAMSVSSLSIEDYLAIESKYPELDNGKMFRWDNYLSFLFEYYDENLKAAYLSTHKLFNNTEYLEKYDELSIFELIDQLNNVIGRDDSTWIVNIDVDYFFAGESYKGKRYQVFHDEYIERIIDLIYSIKSQNKLGVLTIALSPECCGDGDDLLSGWNRSEVVAKKILNKLGYDFHFEICKE